MMERQKLERAPTDYAKLFAAGPDLGQVPSGVVSRVWRQVLSGTTNIQGTLYDRADALMVFFDPVQPIVHAVINFRTDKQDNLTLIAAPGVVVPLDPSMPFFLTGFRGVDNLGVSQPAGLMIHTRG